MNYFQWFKKDGWKKYVIPFAILIFGDYNVYRGWEDLINVPAFGIVLELIAIVSVHIVALYFSIVTYKQSQSPEQ